MTNLPHQVAAASRVFPASFENFISKITQHPHQDQPEWTRIFRQCFVNSYETSTQYLEDGTTFIITGDIPAMWLRDSSAQVRQYIPLAAEDPLVRQMIRGLIRRQACYISIDPYANAFNRESNGNGHIEDITEMSPWVWERKYELDSLCYPLWLIKDYWDATQDESIFDDLLYKEFQRVVDLLVVEQQHDALSPYHFERPLEYCVLPTDTLPLAGHGTRTNYTGMTWSGFRPSDDRTTFGYLIPSNMFAVVVLGYLIDFTHRFFKDTALVEKATRLRDEIEFGIQTYGIIKHPRFGKMYAYETDGYGNYNLMDDANVPSLLSIPYIGYRPVNDPIYQNTRAFVLSIENPYYYQGRFARGVGSPHTPPGYIWPIALAIQGLTASEPGEMRRILDVLTKTTGDTGYMHEAFNPENPTQYTRSWFGWANNLFSTLVCKYLEI